MRVVVPVISALVLAACGKVPQDVVPENGRTLLPPVVTMQITPIVTPGCKPKSYVALVAWFIPAQLPFSGVEVRMGAPDGNVFAASRFRNHGKQTGLWVHEGTTFFLIDAASRQVLARGLAGSFDCKEDEK